MYVVSKGRPKILFGSDLCPATSAMGWEPHAATDDFSVFHWLTMTVNPGQKGSATAPSAEMSNEQTSSAESRRVTPGAILVVDDNRLNAELVTDLLEMHGFHVQSTDTAETGIIMARAIMPELILMDIHLPGMDGINATKILKDDPATSHLKVIGLTAEISDAAGGNFDGCLAKPFDTHTFVERIKSFLCEPHGTG
jgi:two-component system cell cycle response regulator DivK